MLDKILEFAKDKSVYELIQAIEILEMMLAHELRGPDEEADVCPTADTGTS